MTTTIDTWIAGSGDWFNAANWSNGVPAADSQVVIDPAAASTITFAGGTGTADSISAGTNAVFDMSGGLLDLVAGGTFGALYDQSGGTLEAGGTVAMKTGSLAGGEFTGSGTLQADSISIGTYTTTSIGTYTVGGTAVLDATGTVVQTGDLMIGDAADSTAQVVNDGKWLLNMPAGPDILAGSASATFTNNGWLGQGISSALIYANFINTGTIDETGLGLALLGATNDIGGTLTGSIANGGAPYEGIILGNGTSSTTIHAGTVIDVPALWLRGTVQVEGNLTYAREFLTLDALVDLGTNTLDLTWHIAQPTSTLDGVGTITGAAGAMVDISTFGRWQIGHIAIGGDVTLDNSGFVQILGEHLVLGDSPTSDAQIVNTGSILLASYFGAQPRIDSGSPDTRITNHGEVRLDAATAAIGPQFDSDGTIEVNVGTLQFDRDFVNSGTIFVYRATIQILGDHNVLGGSVRPANGNGSVSTLIFGGASQTTLDPSFTIMRGPGHLINSEIENAATIFVGGDMQLPGVFRDAATGTTEIDLGSHTLYVGQSFDILGGSGEALITGSGPAAHGGTLLTQGSGSIANMTVGGSALLWNAARITQTGDVTLGDTPGQRASLLNVSTATYTLAGDWSIATGDPGESRFNNRGLFLKNAGTGTATISADFVTDGTVEVTSGTLDFTNALSNSGTLLADGGALHTDQPLYAVGTVELRDGGSLFADQGVTAGQTVDFMDATSTMLALGLPARMLGTIEGFQAGNTIDVAAAVTGGNYAGNQLTLVNNGTTVATLTMPGPYTSASFTYTPDGHGGTFITDPPAAGAMAIQAGSGNETLTGSAGADTITAGTGNATIQGGGGGDLIRFVAGQAGGSDLIEGFTAADSMVLVGYGAAEVQTALASAVSGSAGTTLTLSDQTRITFAGIGSLDAAQFHSG